jgi:hypothetical protein
MWQRLTQQDQGSEFKPQYHKIKQSKNVYLNSKVTLLLKKQMWTITTGEKNSISHHPFGPGHGKELEYSKCQLLGFPHMYAIEYSLHFMWFLLQWIKEEGMERQELKGYKL